MELFTVLTIHLWSFDSFASAEDAGLDPIATGIITTLAAVLHSTNVSTNSKEDIYQVIRGVAPSIPSIKTGTVASARVVLLGIVLKSIDESVWTENAHETSGSAIFCDLLENIEQCESLEFTFAGKSLHSQSLIAALTWLRCLSQAGWQAAERVLLQALLTKVSHGTLCFLVDLMTFVADSAPLVQERWVSTVLPDLLRSSTLMTCSNEAIKSLLWRLSKSTPQKNAIGTNIPPKALCGPKAPGSTVWLRFCAEFPADGSCLERCLKTWLERFLNRLNQKLEGPRDEPNVAPTLAFLTSLATCINLSRDDKVQDARTFVDSLSRLVEGIEAALDQSRDDPEISVLIGETISALVGLLPDFIQLLGPEQLETMLQAFEKWAARDPSSLLPLEVLQFIGKIASVNHTQLLTNILEKGMSSADWTVRHEALVATVAYASISVNGPPNLSQSSRDMVLQFIRKQHSFLRAEELKIPVIRPDEAQIKYHPFEVVRNLDSDANVTPPAHNVGAELSD
ncbi:hypothetical protein HK097_003532, partial [Rhizophlyctis rosea]